MPGLEHVSDEDLRAYQLGDLPERLCQSVSDHVVSCATCEAVIRRLDAQVDPFLRSLRRALNHAADDGTLSAQEGCSAGASAEPVSHGVSTPVSAVGQVIGGYAVLGELGRGGMGVVYQARQARPDRLVALKMILAGRHVEAERRARFQAEADAIARLHHPHIVQVYEAGEHEGLPYLVLEYCPGGNLARHLGGAPQAATDAVRWLDPLVQAVAHAHQAGVVHRDLKPANVLLTADGQVKISDFGLARAERPELTATGAIVGTPSYMAPEQAAGGREVGPPADIYALGAILYEMMTGRPPFHGASALETLALVQNQDPVSPRRLQPKVPRDLETICLKCLQKTPAKRYTSAAALADDLRRFQEGRSIKARPTGAAERTWRWCRRNPGWAAMVASVTALLLVIAIGASLGMIWLGAALQESENARLDADANLTRAQQAERATEEKLFEAELAQARGTSLSRRLGQRFDSLAVLTMAAKRAHKLGLPPEKFLALRNAAILALSLSDLQVAKRWDGFPPGSDELSFNDDLSIYVRTNHKGDAEIRRVADGSLIQRIPDGGMQRTTGLSPDGRFLALKRESKLRVWRLEGSSRTLLLEKEDVASAHFHDTKAQLGIEHTNGAMTIWDLDTAQKLGSLPSHTLVLGTHLAMHPAKPLVACVSYYASKAQIFNWETGELVRTIPLPMSAYDAAWQPHGQLLAISDGDGSEIHLFDESSFQQLRTLRCSFGGTRLAFSPKGDLLATFDWSGTTRLFDVATGQVLAQTPVTKAEPPMWRPRFSRDGRRLAGEVFGKEIRIWQIATAREYRTLAPPSLWPHIAPDNRLLAAYGPGGLHFWDLATGFWLGRLDCDLVGKSCLFSAQEPMALLAATRSGLQCWPIEPVAEASVVRIGPPTMLSPVVPFTMDWSRNGNVIAAAARTVGAHQPFTGAWILHPDKPDASIRLDKGKDMADVAVSPDGRWVATCPHVTGVIKVYDARDGRLEIELGDESSSFPRFSPDGRWLSISGVNGALYDTENWKPGLRFSGLAQFSPDSRLLAVAVLTGIIRLLDIDRDMELAEFEDPRQRTIHSHLFSPDATRLITASDGVNGADGGIHVWDLRAIRQGLKELDLDWDMPDYAPASPLPTTPLRIEVVK